LHIQQIFSSELLSKIKFGVKILIFFIYREETRKNFKGWLLVAESLNKKTWLNTKNSIEKKS